MSRAGIDVGILRRRDQAALQGEILVSDMNRGVQQVVYRRKQVFSGDGLWQQEVLKVRIAVGKEVN